MKCRIKLLLSILVMAVMLAACTKLPPVFEQLKTETGMAALIDEVQSGRAQYLGASGLEIDK